MPTATDDASHRSEAFLQRFHDTTPGLTPTAFGNLQVSRDDGGTCPSTYAALMAQLPGDAPRHAVLDLACGDGHLLALMARDWQGARHLWGADLSRGELAAAARRPILHGATLLRAHARSLPLSDSSVDVVTCHMALMLMPEPSKVLAEIRRVLRPGGWCLVLTPAVRVPDEIDRLFIEAFRRDLPHGDDAPLRLGQREVCDRDALTALLDAAGFSAIYLQTLHAVQHLRPDELWADYEAMYDLAQRTPAARAAIRAEWQPLAEAAAARANGLLTREQRFLCCRAQAA